MVAGVKTGGRRKGTPNVAKAADATAGAGDRAREGGGGGGAPDTFSPSRARAADPAATKRGRPANPVNPGFPPYRIARVADLVPYARNSTTHSPAQISMIVAMIREYGFTNPVLVDGRRGILAGHGRILAAQQLGMESVPTVELSHLTAMQRRAYVMADNQAAKKAGLDAELQALELGELRDGGFDLAKIGFGELELAKLFGEQDFSGSEPAPRAETTTLTETRCPSCGHSFAL